MGITFPGESEQYRAARDALLEREVALRREIEAVAAQRRALPPGGVVPQDYVFAGAEGDVRLSELFAPGHDALLVYSFMFPRYAQDDRPGPIEGETAALPLAESPCPSCVSLLDQWDGAIPHADPLISFVVAAQAPAERLLTFGRERGWRHLRLVSCAANSYARDYGGVDDDRSPRPMLNVFRRDGEAIRHFWASELLYGSSDAGEDPRHLGLLEPIWNMLDVTPAGRPPDWDEQLRY